MRSTITYLIFGLLLLGCTQRQEPVSPPWGGDADTIPTTDIFDLGQIEQAGELIAVTLSGPDTYYDFRGRQLGLQYLLCERFARHLGVKLRMETCRDTLELLRRIEDDADLAAIDFCHDSLSVGWRVGSGKPELSAVLSAWYKPTMLAEVRSEEKQLLSQPRVQRQVFAPMLSKGVISRYDGLFKLYSKRISWDWRLLAAQCYQESTFDPNARSWAGAQGLMQIMPQTADHLGLPRSEINQPDRNIEAAVRYLKELDREFMSIRDRQERQNMVLASYNGGIHHVRDAMRLARRDGKNPNRWADVREYILRLSEPHYYQDSIVEHGYMRGSETADYVDKIRQRYATYRRSVRP